MLEFDEKSPSGARIKVVGVGGGGGNAINTMISSGLDGVQFVAANTDLQALEANNADLKLQLGNALTRGLGAGANPEIGRNAALEDRERLVELLKDSEMVFVTAGMGGGTGTGAAPVIARVARELGALTVAVVTKPFHFEGKKRRRQAEEGIAELRDSVDTLITIPNQRLLTVAGETTTMLDTFRKADEVLFHAVRGISDLITVHGLINLDFADVRTIMAGKGMALMGTGEANGDTRAINAAKMAISSPLLEEISLSGAMGVLINITAGPGLTLFEVNEASSIIQEEAHEDANIIFGAVIDENLGDTVRVTVIATGFEQATENRMIDSRPEIRVPENRVMTEARPVMPTSYEVRTEVHGEMQVHGDSREVILTPLTAKPRTVAVPAMEPPQPKKMGAAALEHTLDRNYARSLRPGAETHAADGGGPAGAYRNPPKDMHGQGVGEDGSNGFFTSAARRFRNLRSGSGAGATRGNYSEEYRPQRSMKHEAPKELDDMGFDHFREDEYDIPTFLRKQAD